MSRPPGLPKTGGGNRKGIPNKTTAEARAAIAKFVDGNAHRLQKWLDEIADGKMDEDGKYLVRPDPEKAFSLFQSVIEYHVPKLARMENTHSNPDGSPMVNNINVIFGK